MAAKVWKQLGFQAPAAVRHSEAVTGGDMNDILSQGLSSGPLDLVNVVLRPSAIEFGSVGR